jgi:hypothetical protein
VLLLSRQACLTSQIGLRSFGQFECQILQLTEEAARLPPLSQRIGCYEFSRFLD